MVKSLKEIEAFDKKCDEVIFEHEAEGIQEAEFQGKKEKVIHEIADLWFHTMVLLENEGLELEDVLSELESRFGTSGHEEKSLREENRQEN